MKISSLPLTMLLPSLSLILLTLLQSTSANTYFNIHMPSSLNKHGDGGYPHQMGHFGQSAMARVGRAGYEGYGSMSLEVYLAPSDLCHHVDSNVTTPSSPFLYLVGRGSCTYVTKTRRAQHMGAAGLLIADNICIEADGDQCDHNGSQPVKEVPVVADDGSGGDVTIPALLLRKQDGDDITQTLQKNQAVLATMRWEPVSYNETANATKAHFGMVLDLMDRHTPEFTSSLKHIALAVGKEARFYPTYLLYSGDKHPDDSCELSCYDIPNAANKRYCYPHSRGKEVVQEILRRLCIWKYYGDGGHDKDSSSNEKDTKKTGLEGEAFWNYVEYFDKHCAKDEFAIGDKTDKKKEKKKEECIQHAYTRAKLDLTQHIDQCTKDGATVILDEHLRALTEYGNIVAPSVWVGNATLPQDWSPPTPSGLLQALCVAFPNKKGVHVPEACNRCLGSSKTITSNKPLNDKDVIRCAKQYYEDNYKYPHRHMWRTFWLFWFFMACGAGGYVLYRRRQDEMDLTSDGLFNPLRSMNDRFRERFQNRFDSTAGNEGNLQSPYMPLVNGNNENVSPFPDVLPGMDTPNQMPGMGPVDGSMMQGMESVDMSNGQGSFVGGMMEDQQPQQPPPSDDTNPF